jgi:hypothetical protein
MVRFCDERGVPYELCGKIIVATTEDGRDSAIGGTVKARYGKWTFRFKKNLIRGDL